MTIGNRIKDLRKQKKLNQTELGEVIGVSLNTLYAIETGKSDISSEALLKLSDFFEVSTDYLLKGIETERTISESEQEMLEVLRTDKEITNVVMGIAKLKKKAISYLGSYQQHEAHAA